MAHDKDAKSTTPAAQTPARPKRHWFRRVLLLLVVIVVVGAGGAYWFLFIRVHGLEVYKTGMETIEKDKELQGELGQPITASNWPPPNARVEEGETDLLWDVEGPKGRAQAHAHARLTNKKWDIVVLDVVLASGKKIPLADSVKSDNTAPLADYSGTSGSKPKNNTPPPSDIEMPIPPDTPPAK